MTAKGFCLAVVFLGLIGTSSQTTMCHTVTWANPPMGVLLYPEDADLPAEEAPADDPEVRESISRQIQGAGQIQGGRAVPPEIRELIETSGSVIKGSALDPEIDALNLDSPHRKKTETTRQRLRAAEMMLKSARLLEKIPQSSETQKRLVNQMRQEAVRLMADEYRPQRIFVGAGAMIAEKSEEPSDNQR